MVGSQEKAKREQELNQGLHHFGFSTLFLADKKFNFDRVLTDWRLVCSANIRKLSCVGTVGFGYWMVVNSSLLQEINKKLIYRIFYHSLAKLQRVNQKSSGGTTWSFGPLNFRNLEFKMETRRSKRRIAGVVQCRKLCFIS